MVTRRMAWSSRFFLIFLGPIGISLVFALLSPKAFTIQAGNFPTAISTLGSNYDKPTSIIDENVGGGRISPLFQSLTSSLSPSPSPKIINEFTLTPTPMLTTTTSIIKENTIVINSNVDDVDVNPGDGSCATILGTCTLRAAIQEANANSDADKIILPSGTYRLTLPGSGEDASASGDLDITSPLSLSGNNPTTTIIEGGSLDRVFDIGNSSNNSASVSISNITVRDGTDNGANAPGGIRIHSFIVSLDNVVILDNIGEGIGVDEGALSLNNCLISHNINIGVGGLRSTSSILRLTNSTIRDNIGAWGGLSSDTNLNMSGCTINNNQGSMGPGGIQISGEAIITNSTISSNQGSEGGGIWADQATISIQNSTMAYNVAQGKGGNYQSGEGGGIYLTDTSTSLSMKNSILSNNISSSTKSDCAGNILSEGYNIIGNSTGCTITLAAGDLIGAEPQLSPLRDNGGTTFTHALSGNSLAIDAGNPKGCTDNMGLILTTDQRGSLRPMDGNLDGKIICDIGAYEAASVPLATQSPRNPSLSPTPSVEYTSTHDVTATFIPITSIPLTPTDPVITTPPPISQPTLLPTCRELIINGNFENSDGWSLPSTAASASYDITLAHSGLRSVRTGITDAQHNNLSYSSVWQQITIPSSIQSATLSFWAFTVTNGPVEDYHGGDLQMVMLLDYPYWAFSYSPIRQNLLMMRNNNRTWLPYQFDLKAYAGQTLWLYFGTYNNGWAASWGSPMAMFIDDVSLIVCGQ